MTLLKQTVHQNQQARVFYWLSSAISRL